MLAFGLWIYLRKTRALDRTGTYALWSFVALLILIQGQPPTPRSRMSTHFPSEEGHNVVHHYSECMNNKSPTGGMANQQPESDASAGDPYDGPVSHRRSGRHA